MKLLADVEAYIASGKNSRKSISSKFSRTGGYSGIHRQPASSIVHRDINPRNLIAQPTDIRARRLLGVQDAIRTALIRAHARGHGVYIPVEQVSGRRHTDLNLYALPHHGLYLTGRNPAELPMRNLKIDLSGLLYLSPRLSSCSTTGAIPIRTGVFCRANQPRS